MTFWTLHAPPIGLLNGSIFTLSDNVFTGEHWAGSFLTNGTVVTARNNIFQGGDYTAIEIGLTPMDFHGNHILNGGGASVLALWERGSLDQPYTVDLSGNYWGTDDANQIAEWIDDYNDHPPMDNYHYVVIDYEPFIGVTPVPDVADASGWNLSGYPNPFNPQTTIRYDLPVAGQVSLGVYDLRGRRVRSLLGSVGQTAGHHEVAWDGRDDAGTSLSSGTYLLRVEAEGSTQTSRVTLVR